MRGSWALVPLLVLCTACPETWREGGTIDRALAKDLEEERRERNHEPPCTPLEKWDEVCGEGQGAFIPAGCRDRCRPKRKP